MKKRDVMDEILERVSGSRRFQLPVPSFFIRREIGRGTYIHSVSSPPPPPQVKIRGQRR